MVASLEHVFVKNASIDVLLFFYCHYISVQDMQSSFGFLVSVINHYHTNGLHLFGDSLNDSVSKYVVTQNIFLLLSKALRSRINSWYNVAFQI